MPALSSMCTHLHASNCMRCTCALSSAPRHAAHDVWAYAVANTRSSASALPVLLVEKVATVSDGIFDNLQGEQWGPKRLRLILLDKGLLDLEAPFRRGQNQTIVSRGSVMGASSAIYLSGVRGRCLGRTGRR